MLYVILLLILAVLLFGSSVVLGAMGWILGFAVAVIALAWASITFNLDPLAIGIIAIVGFFALCGLIMLIANMPIRLTPKTTSAR